MANNKEAPEQAIIRWKKLDMLKEAYPVFKDFLYDGMTELLGFKCSPVQMDIADYLQKGPLYRMVQAQRSQAKSTITAFYSVWRLIHNPSARVLIFSAGEKVASEISMLIHQIIHRWDIIECLKPDTSAGDRSSSVAFDVHHTLKGVDKSPSVSCLSVTSNMQGVRADILIADDIESSRNSRTEVSREQLEHITKDFSSICKDGDIIYLGTPQSQNSIYNNLPSRGFDVRIWTGRYPTDDEVERYGELLAPYIRNKRTSTNTNGCGLNGNRGAATDPIIQPEEVLVAKERDQGAAYFQLQYMLDTSLTDEGRYPLKTRDLIVTPLGLKEAPVDLKWSPNLANKINTNTQDKYEFHRPHSISKDMQHYTDKIIYVDTSGRGSDETAYAVVYMLNGVLFWMATGAVSGGFCEEAFEGLSRVCYKYDVNKAIVESNFSDGGFSVVWKPLLDNYYQEWSKGERKFGPEIIDDRATLQKELRIIDTLEPILGRHSLIMSEDVIEQDRVKISKYPAGKRRMYSVFFQLEKITRERGSLRHDDALDCLAGACRYFRDSLQMNSKRLSEKVKSNETLSFLESVLKNGFRRDYSPPNSSKSKSSLSRYGL
jgi:hypothetical protein